MFQPIIQTELLMLLRSRWLLLLPVLLLALCLFAAYNGKQKVEKRRAAISQAMAEVAEGDQMMRLALDSLAAGHAVRGISPWRLPSRPTAVGNYHPRVAAVRIEDISLIATGQSDLYADLVKPTLTGEDFALNFTEMTSPVQLMFGSFDLSFVLIYLLPLIVIAFSFDLLSGERERGTLRLLAAQPMEVFNWLMQKTALRFGVLAAITAVSLLAALVISGVSLTQNAAAVGQFLLLSLAYLLFWFGLAWLVNLAGKSSAQNAVSLLALWVGIVLLIPSVVSQLASSLHPAPSRTRMIHEMRSLKAETEKEQDQILAEYLRNHPELAVENADDPATAYGWWQRYFAAQDLVKQKLEPLFSQYDRQLALQQAQADRFRFASPAILMQEALSDLAKTSTPHYQDYRKQVIEFAAEWRAFFLPMIFKNQDFTLDKLAALPAFRYEKATGGGYFQINLWSLLLYALGLPLLGMLRYRRSLIENLVVS